MDFIATALLFLSIAFLDVFTMYFTVLRAKFGEAIKIEDNTISETEKDFNKWFNISNNLFYAFWVCLFIVVTLIEFVSYYDLAHFVVLLLAEISIFCMSLHLWKTKDYIGAFASLLLLTHFTAFIQL